MGQVSLFASLGGDSEFENVQYQLVGSDAEYTDKEIQLFEGLLYFWYSVIIKMGFGGDYSCTHINNKGEIIAVCMSFSHKVLT